MTNRLNPNETLAVGNSLTSQDGRFTLIMQQDNNLVLYMAGAGPLWASNTVGSNGTRAIMQDDGNLVIYDPNGHPVWASNTVGNPGASLVAQNDGNVVIYSSNGNALWATNTPVTPVGGTRLSIRLESIQCFDPEDIVDGDELYIAGAAVLDDGSANPKTRATVVAPIQMKAGFTRNPPLDQAVVFDDAVPAGANVRCVLRAFDEDVAKDWANRPEWVDMISKSVAIAAAGAIAAGIAATPIGWPGIIAGSVTLGVLAGIYAGANGDRDDELGSFYLVVPTQGLRHEEQIWQFRRDDWTGYSSWRYAVRLTIDRS
jgi:hypothetical protein